MLAGKGEARIDRQARRRAGLRLAHRGAVLRQALRRGDVLAAARAWERLRVDGAVLTHAELAAAHAARAALGRAIRAARERRAHPAPGPAVARSIAPSPRARSLRRAKFAAAVGLVAGCILLLVIPSGTEPAPASFLDEVTADDPTPGPHALTGSPAAGARGRMTAPLPPLVLVRTDTPEPQPTASAAPSPSAAPALLAPLAPIAAAAAVLPPSASAAPGSVGSTGGAPSAGKPTSPFAEVGATAVARTPRLNFLPPTPPPLPSGSDRFLFRVLDQRTGTPLANVCVIYGTLTCTDDDPHTNANGYYWLDLPSRVAEGWSFTFTKAGYVTATLNVTYRKGQGEFLKGIALRPR